MLSDSKVALEINPRNSKALFLAAEAQYNISLLLDEGSEDKYKTLIDAETNAKNSLELEKVINEGRGVASIEDLLKKIDEVMKSAKGVWKKVGIEKTMQWMKEQISKELYEEVAAAVRAASNDDKMKSKNDEDHVSCPITLDIYKNPIVVSSGHSYEHDMLMQHLKKNGNFDPLTRKPIHPMLVHNKSLSLLALSYSTSS